MQFCSLSPERQLPFYAGMFCFFFLLDKAEHFKGSEPAEVMVSECKFLGKFYKKQDTK